jgi:hypothetical protein
MYGWFICANLSFSCSAKLPFFAGSASVEWALWERICGASVRWVVSIQYYCAELTAFNLVVLEHQLISHYILGYCNSTTIVLVQHRIHSPPIWIGLRLICSCLLYVHTPEQSFVFPFSYYCRFHSTVGLGDTVSVIGEFGDQGECIVDHDSNLVIIHPELLISGTQVSIDMFCYHFVVCSRHHGLVWTT